MEIQNFLQALRPGDEAYCTHVSMVSPHGKYQISVFRMEEFWDLLAEELERKRIPLGIAERPSAYTAVVVDVDIKIKEDMVPEDLIYKDVLYTTDQVKAVVAAYQDSLREIIDCTDQELTCLLLEKDKYLWTSNGADPVRYIKSGFHLHFPYLFMNKSAQCVQLYPRVKSRLDAIGAFRNLGVESSGGVIDENSCTVPWLMYGNQKENGKPYLYSKTFDHTCTEVDLEDHLRNYPLYDHENRRFSVEGRVRENLHRILSIFPFGRKTFEVRSNVQLPMRQLTQTSLYQAFQKQRNKSVGQEARDQKTIEKDLERADELLTMVADWRASDYSQWMQIGWALYNIGDGQMDAFRIWCEFSSRDEEKYNEADCLYTWSKMTTKNITIGTLIYYAQVDNPEEYAKYKQRQTVQRMWASVSGTHNDIAKILHSEYSTEFVCSSMAGIGTWFQFNEHCWEEIEEGVFLRQRLSDQIVSKFQELLRETKNKSIEADGKPEQVMYNNNVTQLNKLIANLKSAPFKNNVMKEAKEVFYNKKFYSLLNQNADLICFNNGVYELKTHTFREGRPEDYISKKLPIDYKDYSSSDNAIRMVEDFLIKIFPNPRIRKYFLDVYSDIFSGGNKHKKIYVWTGVGDNGKSVTQKFFDLMLGQLGVKMNTTYFTGKKVSAGCANPELARTAPPVRHVAMEEPDPQEELNIGELKKLSGGDSYWARDLYERGSKVREVFPMFMISLTCNSLPRIRHADKAIWNRIRVIPFESVFMERVEDCPLTLEEQITKKVFPMDKEFSSKIPEMTSAFAWYLLQHSKNPRDSREPEEVLKATQFYRTQNDFYNQFIMECLIQDKSGSVRLQDIYNQLKEWYRDVFPTSTLPTRNDLNAYLEMTWSPSETKVWKGWRIRMRGDEGTTLHTPNTSTSESKNSTLISGTQKRKEEPCISSADKSKKKMEKQPLKDRTESSGLNTPVPDLNSEVDYDSASEKEV